MYLLRKGIPNFGVETGGAKFFNALTQAGAEVSIGKGATGKPNYIGALYESPLFEIIVQGWDKLTPGQVTRCTENNDACMCF